MKIKRTMNGHWVYGAIVIPAKKIYIGFSGQKYKSDRHNPNNYKATTLWPYIEQYGWENIHFFVFKDGLTEKQAEVLEDLLITQAKLDDWCINKQDSGGKYRDNPVEYMKQYRDEHKEDMKQYNKQYSKQLLSTPAGKIYNRVNIYNYKHPDRMIITAMEAKDMYELTGYIPDFIKNNDLL